MASLPRTRLLCPPTFRRNWPDLLLVPGSLPGKHTASDSLALASRLLLAGGRGVGDDGHEGVRTDLTRATVEVEHDVSISRGDESPSTGFRRSESKWTMTNLQSPHHPDATVAARAETDGRWEQ
jgi:hypothetical protein